MKASHPPSRFHLLGGIRSWESITESGTNRVLWYSGRMKLGCIKLGDEEQKAMGGGEIMGTLH